MPILGQAAANAHLRIDEYEVRGNKVRRTCSNTPQRVEHEVRVTEGAKSRIGNCKHTHTHTPQCQ